MNETTKRSEVIIMEKMKKIDPVYTLVNILLPFVVLIGTVALGVLIYDYVPEQVGMILSIVGVGFFFLWWAYLGRKLYEMRREKTLAALSADGFSPSHTFNADGCTLVVDLDQGKIALVFRWNPKKAYVRSAGDLSELRVDDGRGGASFMEGSSRVSFLFQVDGMKIRVNTFTSNKRWRMDSDYILTGISKADVMVEALAAAGAKKAG